MIKKIITLSLICVCIGSLAMDSQDNNLIIPAAYRILKDKSGQQLHTWHSNHDVSITYYTANGAEVATFTSPKQYPVDTQQRPIAYFYAKGKNRQMQRSVILFDKNRYELGHKTKINAATIEQALAYAATELNIQLAESIAMEPNVDMQDDRIYKILYS